MALSAASLGDLAGDVVEVRCRPADDGGEGDDAVEAARALGARTGAPLGHGAGVLDGATARAAREPLHGERDLPGAGDAHERDVRLVAAVANERVERAFDEAIDDEVIETTRHDGELRPLRDDEVALEHAAIT